MDLPMEAAAAPWMARRPVAAYIARVPLAAHLRGSAVHGGPAWSWSAPRCGARGRVVALRPRETAVVGSPLLAGAARRRERKHAGARCRGSARAVVVALSPRPGNTGAGDEHRPRKPIQCPTIRLPARVAIHRPPPRGRARWKANLPRP